MAHVNFEKLYDVVKALRDPETGCPWDLEQTHKSLLKYLIEESYEFLHAAENDDFEHMEEEIGDVLLQVLLHCIIADESGKFSLESASEKLADKLIRRHPHVFETNGEKISTEEVTENWKKIKKSEKGSKDHHIHKGHLNFPALFSANKIGEKTNEIGFDWEDHRQVSYKVEEEWQELKEELMRVSEDRQKIEEEIGDFLFSTAQLARHLELNPEEALRKANMKFIKRFQFMENLIREAGKDINDLNQKQMDHYWMETKRREKS